MTSSKLRRDRAAAWLSYLVVGAAATLAHWAFMVMLVERLGMVAWLASGAGAALGAQVAFFANRSFTFDHTGRLWPAWWRFMATAALIALVGMGLVAAGVAWGAHYMLAQAVATGVGLVLGFVINRVWAFSNASKR